MSGDLAASPELKPVIYLLYRKKLFEECLPAAKVKKKRRLSLYAAMGLWVLINKNKESQDLDI